MQKTVERINSVPYNYYYFDVFRAKGKKNTNETTKIDFASQRNNK